LLPIVKVSDTDHTPATYNSPELLDRILPAVREAIGADRVVRMEPVMGGEDFSEYGRTADNIPINIFWLGTIDAARLEKGPPLSLHSPLFWPALHPTIETGVETMTAAVVALLPK
jgi:hippurate hydrolase